MISLLPSFKPFCAAEAELVLKMSRIKLQERMKAAFLERNASLTFQTHPESSSDVLFKWFYRLSFTLCNYLHTCSVLVQHSN